MCTGARHREFGANDGRRGEPGEPSAQQTRMQVQIASIGGVKARLMMR